MAAADITQIRINTGATTDEYSDVQIQELLNDGKTVNEVSRDIWTSRAAQYSSMVNVSESGSSRSMGDLYKNALAMADRFRDEEAALEEPKIVKRSRNAVRV